MKLFHLISVLERIADALDRAYPKREPQNEKGEKYPPLGITTADSEELYAEELKEEAEAKSREEKLMSQYKEFIEWRERNVR